MAEIRRQLTLFVSPKSEVIANIRAKFNPEQFKLIPAHVTLCREDEIKPLDKVIANLKSLNLSKPLRIKFDKVQRFSNGKGVWIPSKGENKAFHELRKAILEGVIINPSVQEPHITLMHPRNSTCTDELFEQITQFILPTELSFTKVSLIEQKNQGKWVTLQEYSITQEK